MAGNSFGTLFRISTFGESHGGAVVDGCPPGLEITESDIQVELNRRHPVQSTITRPRKEQDSIEILLGTIEEWVHGLGDRLGPNAASRPQQTERPKS